MRNFTITDEVRDYAVSHGSWPPDEVVERLRARTAALGGVSGMQIGDDQGQLLTMMARLVLARRAVEVGTFTGYSSLCIARGLAAGGSLLCCDISAEWTAIGVQAWQEAGLADRIALRIAPALDTLRSLPKRAEIDLVFIDADKTGYADYWDELIPRVRPGGVILVDNVLWSGRVVEGGGGRASGESDGGDRDGGDGGRGRDTDGVDENGGDENGVDENTVALRAFNDKVAADDRVEVVVLTAFDGLTIARKL
ncbi:MAG: caffeoyl-CoA O-methyltransferase [Actinomycetota bacterium]|jgi:caffeoyl-CoA O-methyltransferase|nr:caffeoyl-CoA O-methyltransferase [Actinomycetota bacterium]